MSSRVFNVNHQIANAKQIRRDQYRRVRQMVTVNAEHPVIALGLVRDYFKNNPDVRSVRFDDIQFPTAIVVDTVNNLEVGNTQYYFTLFPSVRIDAPTL